MGARRSGGQPRAGPDGGGTIAHAPPTLPPVADRRRRRRRTARRGQTSQTPDRVARHPRRRSPTSSARAAARQLRRHRARDRRPAGRAPRRARPCRARASRVRSTTASTSSSTSRSRSACRSPRWRARSTRRSGTRVERSSRPRGPPARASTSTAAARSQPGGAPPAAAPTRPDGMIRTRRPRRQRDGRRLMARRACDGPGLLAAFRAAVANLEAHVDEVNALNVFPVPDGDTGSNMLATVRAPSRRPSAAGRADGRPRRRRDQLRGAHGRARQLRRHHRPDLPRHGRGTRRASGGSTALDLAHALASAPKTRLRRGRQAGRGHDPDGDPRSGRRGRRAPRSTSRRHRGRARRDRRRRREVGRPDAHACSPILREAGVVDSGGQGLYRCSRARSCTSSARRRRPRRGAAPSPAPSRRRWWPMPTRGSATRRCSSLQGREGARSLDVDAIRDRPRGDRRVGAGRGRRAGAQGPRPQRAARTW